MGSCVMNLQIIILIEPGTFCYSFIRLNNAYNTISLFQKQHVDKALSSIRVRTWREHLSQGHIQSAFSRGIVFHILRIWNIWFTKRLVLQFCIFWNSYYNVLHKKHVIFLYGPQCIQEGDKTLQAVLITEWQFQQFFPQNLLKRKHGSLWNTYVPSCSYVGCAACTENEK